jgi:hypothetical protein
MATAGPKGGRKGSGLTIVGICALWLCSLPMASTSVPHPKLTAFAAKVLCSTGFLSRGGVGFGGRGVSTAWCHAHPCVRPRSAGLVIRRWGGRRTRTWHPFPAYWGAALHDIRVSASAQRVLTVERRLDAACGFGLRHAGGCGGRPPRVLAVAICGLAKGGVHRT